MQCYEISDGLHCSICFNEYDETSHIPLVTICGHTFCKICSNSLSSKGPQRKIECPVCRVEIKIPLASNYSLLALLKLWHANILGPDFIVPGAKKQRAMESSKEKLTKKLSSQSTQSSQSSRATDSVGKMKNGSAAPAPAPAPSSSSTSSSQGQTIHTTGIAIAQTSPTDSESGFQDFQYGAITMRHAPEDQELMKLLIRQNFFKEDGIYAWMYPESDSDFGEEEDDDDEFDEFEQDDQVLGGTGNLQQHQQHQHQNEVRGGGGGGREEFGRQGQGRGQGQGQGNSGERIQQHQFHPPPPPPPPHLHHHHHHHDHSQHHGGGRGFFDENEEHHPHHPHHPHRDGGRHEHHHHHHRGGRGGGRRGRGNHGHGHGRGGGGGGGRGRGRGHHHHHHHNENFGY